MRLRPLRSYRQPDLSNFAVHFTGRPGLKVDEVPTDVVNQSAETRLAGILHDQRILGFPVFGGPAPAVCFTECAPVAIRYMLSPEAERRYPPFGVAFTKDFLLLHGGGPVHYVRGDLWEKAKEAPLELRVFHQRYWPGSDVEDGDDIWDQLAPRHLTEEAQWTHEREWRVPARGEPPALSFAWTDVRFLILPSGDVHGALAGQYSAFGDEYARALQRIPAVYVDASGVILDPTGMLAG